MDLNGLYLDKTSPMPLYEQLRQALLEAITNGKIPEGAKLPTEEELCERLGISRPVARQAYSALITEGYVERMRGRGTFVSHPDTRGRFIDTQLSFAKEMSILGKRHHTEMIHKEWISGDFMLTGLLNLGMSERCYHIKRMRYVNGKPFVLAENYIPESIFPGIEQYDLAKESLYGVFERVYHVKVMRAKRVIRAQTADQELAGFFGVHPGSPVLYITNVVVDQNDRPVDFSKEYLDGLSQKFEFDVINK